MRGLISCVVAVLLVGLLAGFVQAAEKNHYVAGIEGIKAGSAPPPGFYFRQYHVFYDSDEIIDANGDKAMSIDLTLYAMVNRIIWITDYQILGAHYGMDIIIPFVYTSFEAGLTRF